MKYEYYTKKQLIETIECLNHNLDGAEECNKNQYNLLLQLHEKEEKYRWHDLRKDPTDLPTKDRYYLCRVGSKYYPYRVMKYQPYISKLSGKDSYRWIQIEKQIYVYNHFVIAWKEIEEM